MISSDEVNEAVEILLKAEEIKKNAELMREVEPAFDDKIKQLKNAKGLKELWKEGLKKSYEREEEEKNKKPEIGAEKLGEPKDEDDDEPKDEEKDKPKFGAKK